MGDSINNFIELLTKGDFFLIFLIAMMLIIIGVIVYLVKLQINDAPYEKYVDDDEDEEETEDDYYDNVLLDEKVEEVIEDEPFVPRKTFNESPVMNYEPLKSIDSLEEDISVLDNEADNLISEGINISEDVQQLVNEPSISYVEDEPVSSMHFENPRARHIEQSRFDFDKTDPLESIKNLEEEEDIINSVTAFQKEDIVDPIKSFEDEQERNAIISARELENRINELKANGEFEQHEKQLEEYEREQETKAIISYEELLERAREGVISYESEEKLGGSIRVGKVDTSNIDTFSENNEKAYYKEEAFLEAMKEFRRAL